LLASSVPVDNDGISTREAFDSSQQPNFTRQGGFCLVRVVAATAVCALESIHGKP
jgi:hypothetical protein